jgi:hypothetical protein
MKNTSQYSGKTPIPMGYGSRKPDAAIAAEKIAADLVAAQAAVKFTSITAKVDATAATQPDALAGKSPPTAKLAI